MDIARTQCTYISADLKHQFLLGFTYSPAVDIIGEIFSNVIPPKTTTQGEI